MAPGGHLGKSICINLKCFLEILGFGQNWTSKHCDLVLLWIFFRFTILKFKVPLMLYALYLMFLEKKKILLFFAVFSNGSHLGFSTWLNFIILKNPGVWSCFVLNLATIGAVVLGKKLFKLVWICYFQTQECEQQKVDHCDKTTLEIFFIFTILNTYILFIFHPKFSQKYPVIWEKKLVLIFSLVLVMAAILDCQPDRFL